MPYYQISALLNADLRFARVPSPNDVTTMLYPLQTTYDGTSTTNVGTLDIFSQGIGGPYSGSNL